VASWIKQYDIDGIISDNRLGVLTKMYVCVHNASTNVMTGNTTWLTVNYIKVLLKNIYGWVPDVAGQPNLAGELSHSDNLPFYLNT
jgi:hypothetical protein